MISHLLSLLGLFQMRFTLRRLLAGIVLVAIPLAVISRALHPYQSGRLYSSVYSIRFSPDGKNLAVGRYSARDAGVPFKCYVANVSNTLLLVDAQTLSNTRTILHEFHEGNQGPGGLFCRSHAPAFTPNGKT